MSGSIVFYGANALDCWGLVENLMSSILNSVRALSPHPPPLSLPPHTREPENPESREAEIVPNVQGMCPGYTQFVGACIQNIHNVKGMYSEYAQCVMYESKMLPTHRV